MTKYKCTCCLDLDGVVNNYPQSWVDYVNKSLYQDFEDLLDTKFSLSYQTYTFMKHCYRLQGEPAKIREGALDFIEWLKSHNFRVTINTTRPIIDYPELPYQTCEWLERNRIHVPEVTFTEYYKIPYYHPDFFFMIEDELENANFLSKHFRVFLMTGQHNWGETEQSVIRVKNFSQLYIHLVDDFLNENCNNNLS